MSDERHPAVCTPEQIRAAYLPGLRIVWEEAGERDVWEIVAVDGNEVMTRFTAPDGSHQEQASTFEQLSLHSAFPVGPTRFLEEDFETPAGRFHGTHCVVTTLDRKQHFYFSSDHPSPPIKIEGPGFVRQQIERSDL